MNRLYCDHCGLEVPSLNVMVFGKMLSNSGQRAYQERLANMTATAEGVDLYGSPMPAVNTIPMPAVNTIAGSSLHGHLVKPDPPGAFKAAEVCDNCITPWMNGVANICSRSDP